MTAVGQQLDWGTVPTWISSIATAIGIAWALILFQLTRRQSMRSVASAVYCRIDRDDSSFETLNASAKPISNVHAFVAPSGALVGSRSWIYATQAFTFPIDPLVMTTVDDNCVVEFDDAEGRRWSKSADGTLKLLRRRIR